MVGSFLPKRIQLLLSWTLIAQMLEPWLHQRSLVSLPFPVKRFLQPLLRFDHQQPLSLQEAAKLKGKEDHERGITYWGYTLSCCLVELFGDTKIVEFGV